MPQKIFCLIKTCALISKNLYCSVELVTFSLLKITSVVIATEKVVDSTTLPDIEQLVAKKQGHPSH